MRACLCPKISLESQRQGTAGSSNRLQHPIFRECLHAGCSSRACLPEAEQSGTTPRWLMDEWDIPMPGGRILMQPDPGTENSGCLCPCQSRLGVLQGHCVQPREWSPAGGTGKSQAAAARCCPGAADDLIPWCHRIPVIARSLGELMPHSTTNSGTFFSGAFVTAHQDRDMCVPGQG